MASNSYEFAHGFKNPRWVLSFSHAAQSGDINACAHWRDKNTFDSGGDDDLDEAEEVLDNSGIVGNYRGEFLCPVCRRVSNALLPCFDAEPQDVSVTNAKSAKKRKAESGKIMLKGLVYRFVCSWRPQSLSWSSNWQCLTPQICCSVLCIPLSDLVAICVITEAEMHAVIAEARCSVVPLAGTQTWHLDLLDSPMYADSKYKLTRPTRIRGDW